MPPDTARQQSSALARVERLQKKEDKARKQHELQKAKSDSTLKQLAAKAAKDGKAKKAVEEVNGGKASQKEGTPAAGPVQGGKGMGPHKKNPVGDKSTKEAAKFTAKMAAASRKSQLPPDVAGVNEAPQIEVTDGGKGAEGGGGGGAGAGAAAGGGAGAAAGGGEGGGSAGSIEAAKDLTNAPPAVYAATIASTGKAISDKAKTEVAAKNAAMPEFKATMSGDENLGNEGAVNKVGGDSSIERGGEGEDAKAPELKKELRIRGVKGKPGSDIKGAGSDAGADALKSLFSASLGKIDSKSTANTSPGPAPTIQLSGASAPTRGNDEQVQANEKSDAAYVQNVQAINAGPGPEVVKPLEVQEIVPPKSVELPPIPDVSTPAQAAEYLNKGHDQSVYDKADELQDSKFETALSEAEAQFEMAGTNLDTDHASKVSDASAAVDAENAKAQTNQEAQVTAARADISKGRDDTKKKQEKELLKAKGKGDREKKAAQGKIEKRRKEDDRKIGKKYKEGEKKAAAKKKDAEKKAAAKKKDAEKKKGDQSWWERAASAVGSFIDSVASAVSGIFDAMAKVVGQILNKVKDAAMGMIDAAISFATAALDVLGDVLKSMVNNLLADIFPGLASALNDLIDSAVNMAKDAVTAIGEGLKATVAAAIDTLNSGIQAVINAYKTAITTALAIASAAVTGDWEGALKAMLEGALSLAGIPAAEFYRVVGDGMDTINAIIDNPGSFVGNMIDAVGNGFGQFADNFGTHLMDGAVEWLTGSLGEAGLTLPETWDAGGVFGLVLDILGLGYDSLKGKVEERIGEENMAMLESVWGYVEAALDGGLAGLWDHAKDQVGNIWQGVLDAALGFLMEKVVVAAVTKIASMFNPAGAIIQAILMAWNVYNFVQEQAARIMGLVTSVVDSMTQIVAGQLGPAANFIEGSLSDLVPVAISLLANLLGLGGVSAKVKEIIESLQETVGGGVDFVLDKLFELGKSAFDALAGAVGGDTEDPAAEEAAAEQPAEVAGGDPALLPGTTLLSTAGNMDIAWNAERGGQGATSKLVGGPFAGAIAASAIGKMTTQAAAMEGPGKATADGFVGTARTQVMAVDSRGGKYIRGEVTDLGPLRESFDLLMRAILGGANAIGDETGGDKSASEQSHAQIAQTMKTELEAPVDDSISFEDAKRAKEQTAQQLGERFSTQTEEDVVVRVDFNASNDAGDGDIDMTIVIAPNTTELGVSATVGTGGPLEDKLKDLPRAEADYLHGLLTTTPLAAIDTKTSAEVRAAGHALWRAVGDSAYLEAAADKAGDATAKRKLVEVVNDSLIGALKGTYYTAAAQVLADRAGGGTRAMDVYGALKTTLSANKDTYLCQGPAFQLNTRALWRGQGIDGSWGQPIGSGLRTRWRTAVEDEIASNPAQVTAWAGLNDSHKDTLARELFKKKAVAGQVRDSQVTTDVKGSGGALDSGGGPTWWTDTDVNIDFSTTESGVQAQQAKFEHWLKQLALQPAWYTGGLMKFGVSSNDLAAQLHKPTVLDGMMSEYWVQHESNEMAGMTGGGATEWVARAVPASSVTDVEFAATGSTYDDRKADWLAAGAGDAPAGTGRRDASTAGLNEYDQENLEYHANAQGWSNEDSIRGTVPADIQNANPEAHARNEQISSATRGRQDASIASNGQNAGEFSAATIDTQPDTHGPAGQSSKTPGEMSAIPRSDFTDADGERHVVFVTGSGAAPDVHRASTDPKSVKKELRKTGKAFGAAEAIEKLAKDFMKPHTAEERASIKSQIEDKLTTLKTEMARARNEDNDMVQLRLKLEKKLGMEAFRHPASNGAARDLASKAMKIMETQAKDAMAKAKGIDTALITDAELNKDPKFRAAIQKTGMDLGSGYFGAVGKSFDKIKTVFNSGNLRETVQHVVNWGNQWAKQFFTTAPEAIQKLLQKAGVVKGKIDDYLKLQAKLLEGSGGQAVDKAPDKANKAVFKDTTDNQEYKDAKDSEMDRKFPFLPLETLPREELLVIARRHGQKPRETTPTERIISKLKVKQASMRAAELDKDGKSFITAGMVPRGEGNPLTQSKTDRDTAGIGLSNREGEAHGLSDDVLPFLEGFTANMVDENNDWIKAAHELEMPLRAGISGTTNRFMMLASQLGANLPGSRLAMMGHLIPTNAHSFHEIMVAAQGHVPYSQGKYVPMAPLYETDMRDLAKSSGATGEEVDVVLGLKKV